VLGAAGALARSGSTETPEREEEPPREREP
jgi:hypothetical protein